MKISRDNNRSVVISATPYDRLQLIIEIKKVRDYFENHKDDRIRGMVKVNLQQAWNSVPLNAVAFAAIIGKTRQLLVRHGLLSRDPHKYGEGRLSGYLHPGEIDSLIEVLRAIHNEAPVAKTVLDELFGPEAKSTKSLLIRLMGTTPNLLNTHYKKSSEDHVDAYRLLARPNRPRNAGRAEASEGSGKAHREDPVDDGRDGSAEVTEPADSGSVRASAWLADLDISPAQDEAERPHDTDEGVGDVSPGIVSPVAEGVQPYHAIAPIDESGDSYLADLQLPDGSLELAGFQDWEQDFSDEV